MHGVETLVGDCAAILGNSGHAAAKAARRRIRMMIDQEQGRLWTAHGKALGTEITAAAAWLRHNLSGVHMRGVAELLAVTLVFSASLALASLIALQFADGPLLV
jgi:hypothetical protein